MRQPSGERPPIPKRHRPDGFIGRAPTPPSLDPAIAALATAPSLTALTIPWQQPHANQLSLSSLRGPFTALRCLHVVFDKSISDARKSDRDMQPLDLGPLLALRVLRAEVRYYARETFRAAAVIAAAAQQPALQLLDIRESAAPDTCGASVCAAEAPAGAEDLAPRLHVRLELHLCVCRGQDCAASLASLSQLSNLHSLELLVGEGFSQPTSHADLDPLTTLHSLQYLEVQSSAGTMSAAMAATALMAMPLSALTQLTRLSLCAEASPEAGGFSPQARAVVAQLLRLTRLQRLRVETGHEVAAEFKAGLGPLPMLTHLEVVVAKTEAPTRSNVQHQVPLRRSDMGSVGIPLRDCARAMVSRAARIGGLGWAQAEDYL